MDQRYQDRVDPARLVFIDETWTRTNMAPLRGCARAARFVRLRRIYLERSSPSRLLVPVGPRAILKSLSAPSLIRVVFQHRFCLRGLYGKYLNSVWVYL